MLKSSSLFFLIFLLPSYAVAQQRSLGIDLSAWQGNLSATTWNNLHNVDNQDFAFIRSSRGGTTGFYNQSDPANNNGLNTFSQRYDDPYFVQNISRATSAGMLAGPYHFSRPDIATNTGADEADHFIEMAGPWMRPGYLLPVHDLEAGESTRSDNQLAQFSLDFSDRIYEVMGIRPAIYLNGNYAHNVIGGASNSLKTQVVETYPTMWNARPESNINVQTEDPSDYLSWTYGAWDDPPNPSEPWSFWQHSWTGNLNSYNGNLDLNVANGGIEFLKDKLVPAVWTTNSDGLWSTLSNWNSGQAPVAPVQGPGQVPRVGFMRLPSVRLPADDDTVVLDRANNSVAVTLAAGTHEIRKLEVREQLNITGGSLTINYVPSPDSTPIAALFSAPVFLNGGSLSVHTLQVDAAQSFSLGGGELTFDTLILAPHTSTPAEISLTADVNFNPLNDAAAAIMSGAGGGSSGLIDLGGANRTIQVSDGGAAVDLTVDVPIVNGALTKVGMGTLALGAAISYAGDTSVVEGTLSIETPSLADTADLYLMNGTTINLNFAGSPDVVDSLFLDGVSQAVGIWGAVGSDAQFTSELITGTGLLEVTTFITPTPGDFDGNSVVDTDDLALWESGFGLATGAEATDGDADADGDVDGADFLAWQRNLGASSLPLAAAVSQIPEPNAMLLIATGMVALLPRRRR